MGKHNVREATGADAADLLRVRYDAIVAVEVAGVSEERIRGWAERRDLGWMLSAVRDRETWVREAEGRIVSWIAVKQGRVEGLYTDPRYGKQGFASELLQFVESLLRSRGVERLILEASENVEDFYTRRGYALLGPGVTEGARTMLKVLVA